MNAKRKQIRYTFELAEHLGITLAELVGPENVHKYAQNLAQARVLEAMRDLSPNDQECLALLLGATTAGVISTEEGVRMVTAPDNWDRMRTWRAKLTPEEETRFHAAMKLEEAA